MVSAGGVQTDYGPGAFHSGGMVFDHTGNTLYMTGLHYNTDLGADSTKMTGDEVDSESNCFLASISLDDVYLGEAYNAFDTWTSWGTPGVMETCSSMTMHNPSQLVVVGSISPGGMLQQADPSVPLSGMVSVAAKDSLDS